ncbi:retropepsin-like aspartic protease [Nocardioides plantarum]|uniref:Retropepsin-like aspartic protease n=1 Tax=Nocardioides plantarum TaxID=29299 RepID=A0ABV5KDS5_9ACTN|nr:retropepsin-like aspartic protease [Nocardioides plantarum]
MIEPVPFDRVGHQVRIPVTAGHLEGRFLLDSGIGLTTVSTDLARRLGLELTRTSFTGHRMSGQEITVPLARLPRLTVGGHVVRDGLVGVFDLGPTEGESGLDGILGLDLLGDVVVQVDPSARLVELQPDPLLVHRYDNEVPVRVHRDGPSVALFVELRLPSGRVVDVEVDTGSRCLILDTRFMSDCGVGPDDVTETLTGTDETGHDYSRSFATVRGAVGVIGAPSADQPSPRVMFQSIVHDGLLGSDFLDRFVHGFDVRRRHLMLSALEPLRSAPGRAAS